MARGADVAAAALAAGLALAAIPSIRAELVYGAALGYGLNPSDDAPGRLEAYEEAAGIAPWAPLYALRSGDLRLQRAETDPARRGEHLEAALAHYRSAARLGPLDPRVRAGLAQALAATGSDPLTQTRHSVALGPRWPGVLARAMHVYLDAWERNGDPDLLTEAVRACRAISALDDRWGRQMCARRLASSGRDVQGDLLEALILHPPLMREAAAIIAPSDGVLAETLRELAGPAEGDGE